jgi:hypothetical protein
VCFTQIDVPVDTLDSAVVSSVLSALAESALPWLAKHRAAAAELIADEPELAEAVETDIDTAAAATAATDTTATDDTAAGDEDSTADTAAAAATAAAVAKEQKHQQQLLDRAAECGAGAAQAALAVNTFRAASALLEAPAHAATFVNSNTSSSSSSSSGSSSGSSWLCELVRAAAAPSPNGSSLAQLDTLESSWRELWSRWHTDSQRWCSSDRDAPPAAAAAETETSDTAAAAADTTASTATVSAGSVARISSSRANAAAGSGSSAGAGSSMAATLAAALDAERRAMSALDAAAGSARGSSGISTSRSYYAQEDVSALLAEQQQQLQQQQSVSVSASSLSAYISATAAAMGAGTVVLDTSAAVAQLMEMGFEREWAEVALRYTMSCMSRQAFTTGRNTMYTATLHFNDSARSMYTDEWYILL